METKTSANFWWLKSSVPTNQDSQNNLVVPRLDLRSSNSVVDLLEQDKNITAIDPDVDVGSIIEEINRVAAQSPLGPYEKSLGDRSVDDLMKEAERIYMESSKSFEQLSQRSKTSQNISELHSNFSQESTPTPKSLSPLPVDPDNPHTDSDDDDYTEDFSDLSKIESNPSPINTDKVETQHHTQSEENIVNKEVVLKSASENMLSISKSSNYSLSQEEMQTNRSLVDEKERKIDPPNSEKIMSKGTEDFQRINEVIESKNILIKTLEENNRDLKKDIQDIKMELEKTNELLEHAKLALTTKQLSSPEINLELEKALEDLKDSKEVNTALQYQLDTINKSHQLLKNSYDELVNSNKNLDRRVVELDATLEKYKSELLSMQKSKEKLLESEANLSKLFEIEKIQSKSLKLQNEKDARIIQDLNRQIKEMERIIARKHPDSVSALIVAAKENATDTSLTARKILEDRIKTLEQEQINRELQSSKVFLEIQEKFSQMKAKYENHIEDLEVHVNDLKSQLKRKTDTYDVYTQTFFDPEKPPTPQRETYTVFTQTYNNNNTQAKPPSAVTKSSQLKKPNAAEAFKEDKHLLATIKGLQADLTNKEKVISKLQREVDDLRKTNRRLQKEREGSLKSLTDKKEFRSYPEKLSSATVQAPRSATLESAGMTENDFVFRKEEELQQIKYERDRLKQQLQQLEVDYRALKSKRIQDLTALQEAHEREVANYMASMAPLREQLEGQRASLTTLQQQLSAAKDELAIVIVERDHLNQRLHSAAPPPLANVHLGNGDGSEVDFLLKKIAYMEKYYEERELRLRTIVQSLAQKGAGSVTTNRSCEQCSERQKQLIAYKVELDQLLETVRALQ